MSQAVQLIRLSGEALEALSGSGGMTMSVPVMDGLLSPGYVLLLHWDGGDFSGTQAVEWDTIQPAAGASRLYLYPTVRQTGHLASKEGWLAKPCASHVGQRDAGHVPRGQLDW